MSHRRYAQRKCHRPNLAHLVQDNLRENWWKQEEYPESKLTEWKEKGQDKELVR